MKLTLATLFTLLVISCADNTWGDDFERQNEDTPQGNPNPDNRHFMNWANDEFEAYLPEPRGGPPPPPPDRNGYRNDWFHRMHHERRGPHERPHIEYRGGEPVDFRQERNHFTRDHDGRPHGDWSETRYHDRQHGDWSQRHHGDWQKDRQHGDWQKDRQHGDWQRDRQHGDWRKERFNNERQYDQDYKETRKQESWKPRDEANQIPKNPSPKYAADPPDHTKLIPMARYVLRNADWASIATISAQKSIEGFPFTNVKSIVEGSSTNSTGIPYFYMSPLDFTAKDLTKNSRATVLASLEETPYCKSQNWDAEDPRCTRLMLSGKMKKVKEGTPEYTFAKAALFERHPAMANFPADHEWFVAKLKIAQIAMVDWFGGAKYIPVRDYLAYNYTVTVTDRR